MKENEDFSECEFIESHMKIYTYNDFCSNRKAIKKLFDELSCNAKRFYRWYVYANTHMNQNYKNRIWDYLNDFIDDEQLLGFQRFYRAN